MIFQCSVKIIGRGERIRTSGPCLPKTVLYQAELLPDRIRPDDGFAIPTGRGKARPIGADRKGGKRANAAYTSWPWQAFRFHLRPNPPRIPNNNISI